MLNFPFVRDLGGILASGFMKLVGWLFERGPASQGEREEWMRERYPAAFMQSIRAALARGLRAWQAGQTMESGGDVRRSDIPRDRSDLRPGQVAYQVVYSGDVVCGGPGENQIRFPVRGTLEYVTEGLAGLDELVRMVQVFIPSHMRAQDSYSPTMPDCSYDEVGVRVVGISRS